MSTRSDTRLLPRLAAWLSTPGGIVALFIVGFLIRVALAPVDGFPTDMSAFKAWAGRLAERGPWDFYPRGGEEYFVDYPPGYLYVLWILGLASRALGGGGLPDLWIKIPAIAADLGLAWLVMTGATRIAPAAVARRMPVRPLAAAAILLNPAMIFISAVWGQADSAPAVLVVGALLLIGTKNRSLPREAAGMALLAVAVGTKPQAGFVIPVVLLVLAWRHIWLRVAEVDDEEARGREARLGAIRVVVLGLTGVVAGFALFAPFRLFPLQAFDFYREAARTYPVTSVFAFNLWGSVEFWRADSGPDALEIFGVPAFALGIALFVIVGIVVLMRAWGALRKGVDEGRVLFFGSMALTLAGFAVVTRIHERYLFLPLALGAVLLSHRFLRRAFVALTLLYFVNVYFPYVYYLEREGRPVHKFGPVFELVYGSDINSGRMKVLSALITGLCLAILFFGWRALERPTPVVAPFAGDTVDVTRDADRRAPWTLDLHAVGRRGALLALGVFALALLSRIAGLGHPPGMYFDEVYHARTGAEYLGNKEVFEYTHPPFAKEVMGSAIHRLSGFGTRDGGDLPDGVDEAALAPHPDGVVWVADGAVQVGNVGDTCGIEQTKTIGQTDLDADVLVATRTSVLVAAGTTLARFEGGDEVWRATLPTPAVAAAAVGERAYLVTDDGELVTVSAEGEPDTLAIGATSLSASIDEVWVSFALDEQIASWDGQAKRTAVIETDGRPDAIAAPEDVERVFVSVAGSLVAYDTESKTLQDGVGGQADLLGTVPETTTVWVSAGERLHVIEPHSGVVIGRMTLPQTPAVLTADAEEHRLVGIADGRIQCASGRPQFAWRLGSAICGAAMVALVFLLALRLFGSTLAALLAALFLTIDGLAFTIARIAMNDSYTTAFILGAWFCVLSALRAWGRRDGGVEPRPADRLSAIAWLAGAGVSAGLGLASKWVALYAIAGIGLLLLWDAFNRRERSIWGVAGGFFPSAGVLAFLLGIVPLAIYVLTYIPYFSLGHGVGDFLRLQRDMFSYHAGLDASHPFGSPWYGWPFGYRAVFLYLAGSGETRSEMWTIPNLMVIWGGLAAMVAGVSQLRRTRRAALGVVILAAASQYVPWIAVSRVTFMYHYLPVVPWLSIALGWYLAVGLRDWKYRKVAIVAVSVSAFAVFAFLYPILVGWEMSVDYLDLVRKLFPWVI